MTTGPTFRLLSSATLLAGAAGVLLLGARLVRHVVGAAGGGLALFAWSVAFAVLLPVLITAAALLTRVHVGRPHRSVIPNAGWKIPGAGQ